MKSIDVTLEELTNLVNVQKPVRVVIAGDKEIFNATNRIAPIKIPVEQIEEQHSDSTLAYSIQDLNTYSPIQSGSLLIL